MYKKSAFILLAILTIVPVLHSYAAQDKIHLYTWDTYIAPDLFNKFEKETGIKVITDIYSSNEALVEKLESGSPYDVVIPSGNFIPYMIDNQLLQPLPPDLRTIGKNMVSDVKKADYDPGNKYTLPLFYGTTGLVQNIKLNESALDSWMQFFKRPINEKPAIGSLDDPKTVINIASIALGTPFCDGTPDTLQKIQDLLIKQKPFITTYNSSGYSERVAANQVSLHLAWSGDAYRIRQENNLIRYIYPKEGVEMWIDNLAIPTDAQNIDGAIKFIQFILRQDNNAAYSIASGQIPTVEGALAYLPDELRTSPEFNPPENIPLILSKACPYNVDAAYNKMWNHIIQ